MNLQDIANPSEETKSQLQAILQESKRPLSQEESQKFCNWLNDADIQIDYEPQYRDFLGFKCYLEQLDKCNHCDGADVQCSSKQIVRDKDGKIRFMVSECPVRAAKKIIKAAQVPVKFQTCRWWDLTDNTPNKILGRLIDDAVSLRDGLYICGGVGTGKTMLSSIIINERAYTGRRSHFYTVTDLVADLQDFQNPLRREEKLLKVQTTPCLVIDDIGAEHATNWVASTLFSVLDIRYKDNLQTIVNSNFDIAELCERYPAPHGDRISRRLKAMCKPFYMI